MSIIIQTGHSSSYSGRLMQMLYERGLNAPIASLTHELSASDISVKLATALSKSDSVINAKLIDNLIVDLLLANLDWDDWGWESEYNLDALSYWQQSDDNIRFILVFDSPKLLLKQLLGQNITPESVEEAIRTWIAYHQKLLVFFEKKADYCLLIEGRVAVQNFSNVKECVQSVATHLKLRKDWQVQMIDHQTTEDDLLFEIIANEVFKKYPECLVLYNILVEKTTIRLKNHQSVLDPVLLLNAFNQQEMEKSRILSDNASLQDQLQSLMSEKQCLEQRIQRDSLLLEQNNADIRAECQAYKERAQNAESKLELLQVDIKQIQQSREVVINLRQENEFLISQLQQTQRGFGRICEEGRQFASYTQSSRNHQYGAAEKIKNDLPYRLGATMIGCSKSVSGLATLPFALIKEYREFQKHQSDDLLEIEEYQDADEAEKVKRHLSYRLGKVLVDGVKSRKLLSLPVRMGREIIEFKK